MNVQYNNNMTVGTIEKGMVVLNQATRKQQIGSLNKW